MLLRTRAGIQPRQFEQLRRQPRAALHARCQPAQRGVLVRRTVRPQRHFRLRRQCRQRNAQLVRRITDETALGIDGLTQPREQPIERFDERSKLARQRQQRQRREIECGLVLDRPLNVAHRPERPADPPPDRHAQHREHHRRIEQAELHRIAGLLLPGRGRPAGLHVNPAGRTRQRIDPPGLVVRDPAPGAHAVAVAHVRLERRPRRIGAVHDVAAVDPDLERDVVFAVCGFRHHRLRAHFRQAIDRIGQRQQQQLRGALEQAVAPAALFAPQGDAEKRAPAGPEHDDRRHHGREQADTQRPHAVPSPMR